MIKEHIVIRHTKRIQGLAPPPWSATKIYVATDNLQSAYNISGRSRNTGAQTPPPSMATKYQDLVQQWRGKGWQVWLFSVEFDYRGSSEQCGWNMLTALGIAGREMKAAARSLVETAERASCWLWNSQEKMGSDWLTYTLEGIMVEASKEIWTPLHDIIS